MGPSGNVRDADTISEGKKTGYKPWYQTHNPTCKREPIGGDKREAAWVAARRIGATVVQGESLAPTDTIPHYIQSTIDNGRKGSPMRGFACKNTSCGLDSTMCLDHDQTTGAPVPTNPALVVKTYGVSPTWMALRIARYNANRRANEPKAS
jgi:hypothetical protein